MDAKQLVSLAIEAMKYAYTPYSNFQVGAALLTTSGKVYTGCNIENAAYSPTNCAERTAFFKAVSEGERSFQSIAVVGGMGGTVSSYTTPCGVCRQVMMEFCDPDSFTIIVSDDSYDTKEYLLKELLPQGFGPLDLEQ